ncbi:uncharacterized protein LOC132733359 [Ruditapes philippinarum]|uniref:uncharacterized protein LOC132733359 n=1 Tax=Ruditapes philippinarum TaxID=129788 RepID=UPI00295BA6B7|nr:uncharacterized protein LOC132733359 [Ruditapes philippinarum]
MSRYPYQQVTQEDGNEMIKLKNNIVKTICSRIIPPPYFETIPADIDIIEATDNPSQPMAQIEFREIRRKQRQDPMIEKWRRAIIDKKLPPKSWDRDDTIMKRVYDKLHLKRGILYKHIEKDNINQLVVPKCYRYDILKGLHDNVGHPGRERTLALLRERFYWPRMSVDVDNWVSNCNRCLRRKTNTSIRAPLVNIETTHPLEMVCMDYLTLEPSKGGIANILVITDHFTKFAMAIPTRNQTAKTTAEAFYNNFIVHYGIPTSIHSDQGANFQSEIIKELCAITDMKKSRTSIYHPMGNGVCERFNRTLLDMLGTLETSQKSDWKKHIPSLVYAYNSTPHESTKISPYELMFGRKARLPIDSLFAQATEETTSTTPIEYINELKNYIRTTRKIVEDHTQKAKEKQKKYFDRKAKAGTITVGDKVMVKILKHDGKHKIADKFEQELFDVIDQPRPEIPVFKVKSENTGIIKTLHRNHLYPVQENNILGSEEQKRRMVNKEWEKENIDDRPVPKKRKPSKEDNSKRDGSEERNINQGKDKGDVTTEAEDSEYSDSETGSSNVVHTYSSGDAHIPKDSEIDRTLQFEVKDRLADTDEIQMEDEVKDEDQKEKETIVIENEGDVGNTSVLTDTYVDNTEEPKEETHEIIDITEEFTDTNEEHIHHTDGDNISTESIQTIDFVGDSNKNVESMEIDNDETNKKHITHDETEKVITTEHREQACVPKPAPRKSSREKRQPKWFDSYQMNQMVTMRPIDSKLHALNKLMTSGILKDVDSEFAHKLIDAIMK